MSTGGPGALQKVIPEIPEDIPAAFLISQHMPKGFTKALADRLNNISRLSVKEGEENEIIKEGTVYISPGDKNMAVEKSPGGVYKIKLSDEIKKYRYRPSVDYMLESLSDTGHKGIIAVIMTGMGKDGSEGIIKIKKRNGGYIIAQDENTCVVFGMPKAAIETGVVDSVVPLADISSEILKIISK